jgi:HAT1-interacting factor 1
LGAFLSFTGDAEDEAVDMFAEAVKAAEEDAEGEEEEDPEAEPEDDFNAAWEVLDLARAIFEKHKDESGEAKLKLADTYMCLGDVSLETGPSIPSTRALACKSDAFTEKFDQAIKDYTAGLDLKQELLPLSSRHIAEAHYRLCLVLDMTPGQLSSAISHVEKALRSVEARLEELRVGPQQRSAPPSSASDSKGKGKGTVVASSLLKGDSVYDLTPQEIEAELKEMDELRSDLMLKVRDFFHLSVPIPDRQLRRSKS